MKKSFILWAVLIGYTANAQTCSATATIPVNGATTVGGVPLTTLSVGSVTSSGGSLAVGQSGAWQVNLFFANPVNDLIISIFGAGGNSITEDFNFSSDTGTLSISSNNSTNSTITGSTIIGGSTGVGNGVFKIHSTTPYRALVIQGAGGSNGSLLGICSSGFLGTNDVNVETKNIAVDISPNPAKSIMTITSKESLKAYKVFDESGRLMISSSSLKGNKQEVDISAIKAGNYIISIETENQKVNQKVNKKFIKE